MHASHAPFGAPQVLEALIFNMAFLPAPPFVLSSSEISPLDGPAWSLMLEMAINLAYVLMFRWLTTRVLVVLITAALAGLTLSVFVFHSLVLGPLWPTLAGGIARVSFSFPLGVLLYRLDPPPVRLGFLVLPGLLAITCLGGSPWFDLALVVFAAPALVLIAAHSTPKWAALSAYLAAISYALYAIHAPLLMMADGLSHRLEVSPIAPILAVIAGLLVACPLLDHWYDRPLRRWLSRMGSPRAAMVAPEG
jgi:peptidoglycan/LPS O-acetylase OafA/YrhL